MNDIYTRICPNYSIHEIIDDIKDIINNIDEDKDYKIIGSDFVAQIIHIDSNSSKAKNGSSLPNFDFMECENILRNYHGIYSPRRLTFVQIELNNTNDTILVNQIEYEIYNDEKQKLNLSLCKNSCIKIYYKVKNDTKDVID